MFGASVSRPVAGASPPPAEASSAGERSLSPDSSSSGCSSSCPPSPLPRTHAEKLRSLSLVFSVSLKPTLAASRLTSPFLASPLALPDDATNTLAVAPSGDLLFVAATEGRVQVLPLTPLGTPQSRLHRKSAASAKTQGHAPPPRRRRGREDVAGTFEEQWSLCGATPLDEERQWCRQEAAAAREGEWESLSSPASEEGAAASSADLAESGAASGTGVEGLLGVADSSACSPEPETAFLPERFTLLVPSARFRKPGALTRQPGDDEEYEGEDADVEGASSARNRRAVRVTNLSCEILAGEEVLVLTTRGGDVMVFSLKALRARLDEERRSRRDRRGRESVAVDKGGARGDTRPADERPRSLGEAPAARSESFASSASFSSWGEDAELAASLRAMQRAERRREEEEERRIKLWREQERRHTPVPDVWIVNSLGPPTLHSSCQMDVSTWSFACNPFPPTASPRSPSMQPGAWSPRLPLLPFFSSLAFGSNTHHLSFVDLRHLPVGRGSPALPLALGAETPTGPSATAALLPRGVSRRHAQRLIRAAAARLALEGPSTAATSASPAVSSSGSRSPSAARAEDVFSGRCERKLSRDEAGDAARKKRRRGRESRGAEERQEVRQEVRARELPAELRCLRMLCRDVAWAALAAGEEHFASTAEDASEAEDCDAEAASSLRGESDATRAPRSREAQRSSRRRARDGERLLPASRRRSRRSRAPRMGAWSPELQSSSFSSPHLSPASSASPLSPCGRGEAASELRREARDCCRFAPSFLPFPDPNRHVALPDAALFAELYVRPQWLRKRRRGRGDLPCAPLQGLRPSPDAASPRSGFGGGRAAGRGDPEAPARGRWGRRAEAFRRDPSAREPREVEGDAREMRRAALASRAHVLRRTLPAQQAAEEERAILRRRRALRRRLFRLDNGADGEDGEDGEGVAGAEGDGASAPNRSSSASSRAAPQRGPRVLVLQGFTPTRTFPLPPPISVTVSPVVPTPDLEGRASNAPAGEALGNRTPDSGGAGTGPLRGSALLGRPAAPVSAPGEGQQEEWGEVSGDEREEADAADGGRAASEGGSTGDRRETPQAEARHPQEALVGEAPQALPQPQPPSSHLPPLSGQGAPLPVASQEVAPASGFLPRSGHGPAASSPSLSAGRNASASPRPSIPGSGFVSPLPLSSASFASLDSSASDARPRSPSSAPASPVSPVPLTEAAGRPPPPPEGDAGGDTEAAAARAMERAPLREASDSRAEEEEEAEDASGSDEGASARRREEDLEIRRVLEVLRAMRFPEAFVSEALTVVRERSSAADGRALAAFESRGADRGGRPEGARGSLFGRPERRLVRGVARQSAARWNAHDALTPSEHPAVREKRHTQDWLEVPVALVDWLNVYLYRCNAPCVAASLLLHAAAAGRLAPSLRPLSPFASLRGPSPPAFAFRLSGGRRRRTDWAQALSRVASSTSTSVLSSPRGFSSQSAHSPAFSMSLAASDAEAELAEAASDAEPARELGTSAGAAPPSAAPGTGGGEAAEGASPPPQALRSGGASAAFACPRAREEVFECGISSPDLGAHSRSGSRSPSSYSSSGGSLTASAGRAPLARPPVGLCVPRVRVCTHTWNIPSIRFSLCASFLASCSIDRTIRLTRAQPAPRNGDTGRRREARSCRREGEVGEVLAVREIRGWAWAVSWLDVRNLGSFDWDSVGDLSLPPRGSAQLPPSSPGGVFAAAAPPRRRTPGATEAASWAEERQREEDQAQFQQDAIRALLEGCEQRIRHEFTDVVRSSSFNPVTGARVRPRAKAIAETLSLAAGRFWRERSAERTRCQEADPRSASRPGPGDSGGDGGDTGRDRGDSGGDNGERERSEADAGAAQRTSGSRGRSESSAAQRPPARRELDENDDRTGEDERKDKTAPGEDTLLGLCASPSAAAGREARGSQAPTNAWEEAESVDRVQVTGSPRVVRWTPEIAERVSRSLMREWESLQSACRARLEEAQRQFVACAQSYDAIAEALLSLDPALLQDDKALQDEVKLLVGTAAAQRRDLGLWRGRIRSSLLALPSATCSSSASFCSLPLPACLASLSSPTLPGSAQAPPPRFSLDSALEADAFLARARLRAPQHYRGGLHVLRRFREQAEKRNRALESRVSTVQALFDAKASKRDGHSPPHAPAERRAEAELSFESFRRGLSRGEGAATPRETTQSETHEALHMPVKGEKEPSRPAAPASREGGNQGTSTRALEACRDRREAAAAPKEEKGAQRRHATEPTRGPAAEGADAGEGRGRSGRETAVLSGASPAGADSPTDICAIPRLNKQPSSIQIDLLLRRMGAGRRQDPHAGSCGVWGCPRADLTASPLFALERRGGDSSGREPAPRAEPEPDAAMRVAEWRAALERFLVFPPEDQDAAALSALLPPPPCASPLPRASSLRASPCPSASSASCVAAAAPRPRAPWTPRAALLRAFGGPAGGGGTTRPRGAGELAIRSPSEDGDTAQTSRSQRGARGKVAGEGEAREASQSLGTVNDEEKAKLARQLLVATGERSLHLLKPRFELVENSAESGGESDGEASRGDRRGDAAVAQARKALEGGDRAHRGAQGAAWSPSSSRQWRVELERVAFVQDVYPARNAGSDSPRLCLLRAIDAVGLFVCGFQFGQPVVVYAVEKASPDKFFLRVVAMLAATDNALKRRPEELSDLAAEDRLLFATHKFKEDTYTASRVSGLALWHRVLKEGEAADDGAAEREGNRGTCVRARVYILTYSLTLLCYEFTYANGGCRASSPSVSSALPKEHWNEEALELPPGPEGACSTEWTRKNESAGVAGLESCQSACLYPGAGVARGGGGTSSYCFHDDFEVILEEERDFLL